MLGKLHDIIKAQRHIKPWNPTRLQQRNHYIQPGSLSDTCVFGKLCSLTLQMPCTCRIETACTSTLRVLKNKVTVSNCTGLVSLNMQLMQKWTSSDKSLGAGYRVVENGCNSDQIVHTCSAPVWNKFCKQQLKAEQLPQGEISTGLSQWAYVCSWMFTVKQMAFDGMQVWGVACYKHIFRCLSGPFSIQRRHHTFEQAWTPWLDIGQSP